MENNKDTNIFTKTTKLILVVYFPILAALLIICLIISGFKHEWKYVYAILVCLVPALAFIFISAFVPIERVFTYGKKQIIVGWTILYVLKYAILFVVPIVCAIYGSQYFGKWVMFTMTLIPPVVVFIVKMITTYSSKNREKDEKTPINSIKF